jgi:hypothetical protein
VLLAHALDVAAADAEHAVEVEADLAAARQIRLEELVGIIFVLVPDRLLGADARIEDGVGDFAPGLA